MECVICLRNSRCCRRKNDQKLKKSVIPYTRNTVQDGHTHNINYKLKYYIYKKKIIYLIKSKKKKKIKNSVCLLNNFTFRYLYALGVLAWFNDPEC